jgi:hypothetical protein
LRHERGGERSEHNDCFWTAQGGGGMRRTFLTALLLCLVVAGCARPLRYDEVTLPAAPVADRALEERILALDPERVSEADVRNVLAKGPTPRIMLLHGGIYPVHLSMVSFGRFLVEMGYPEAKIRDPYDGSWSHSPYEDAERLAGIAAWYYEKDGMPPMMIGHSQGGMQAVKVLHVLAGGYSSAVSVWNPLTDFAEDRTSIIDPLTGLKQPVVGMRIAYASAIGAGGAAFLLPNQWSLLGRLRTIPDTVEDFTGYSIDVDFWAWTVPGVDASRTFANHGRAKVRNVTLPAGISHVVAPVSADIPQNPAMRAWIERYAPGSTAPPPPGSEDNLLWVADVWWSVKKYWVIEAQRLIRARRAGSTVAGS